MGGSKIKKKIILGTGSGVVTCSSLNIIILCFRTFAEDDSTSLHIVLKNQFGHFLCDDS